ncbi:MAG: hypothetical protein JWM95_1299 [Gemmatimonadetes bacterium]|nr:hypothetical protein [Gemmatimonadota bacterium]
MRLSTESPRARWLLLGLAWILVGWLALLDVHATREYVALLDESGTLVTDSLPMHQIVPANYADAQTWVRLALAVDSAGQWRVRSTKTDNAPAGRAVHWSSGFVHLIRAAGHLRQWRTGEPFATATERALPWFNLPLFLAAVVVFSTWAARRLGAAAGVLIATGMVGHPLFYAGFAPSYVDHHGLLSAASMGVVLGAVLMGAGWRRSTENDDSLLPHSFAAMRRDAVFSGICGAIGMWISAASVIPTIAFAGLAGLIATLWLGRAAQRNGAQFNGDVWRLWSRAGGGISLVAYLIEYAPANLEMHLEVNHPLYALAWLGGGELVALIGESYLGSRGVPRWRATLAACTLLAAPLVIALGGRGVFAPLDPGIAALHHTISEFRSAGALVRSAGWAALRPYLLCFMLVLPAGVLVKRGARDRVLIGFASMCVVAGAALALWQNRWWLAASGPELCLLVVVLGALLRHRSTRAQWIVVTVICAVFLQQAFGRIALTRSNTAARAVTEYDAAQPLYRDIAAALRTAKPAGDIVLLSSPNASSGIAYYGGFSTLGTLYWENAPGLRAAAEIFSATSDDSARALLKRRGVTHIVLVGRDDFLRQYLHLARPGASNEAFDSTFGHRLTDMRSLPRWLRPIPFPSRGSTQSPELVTRALEIVADQSQAQATWNIAIAQAAMGNTAGALESFHQIVESAPPAQRSTLLEQAGRDAYRIRAHRAALQLFGEAIAVSPTTTARAAAAWILATSPDDTVRDGPRALALAEALARNDVNDPALLDVLAAALAESGRFSDAVAIARRMSAISQSRQDAAAAAKARDRLAAYTAGRPWRS